MGKGTQRGNVDGDHELRLSGSSFAPGTWSLKSNQKLPTCTSSSRAGCRQRSTIRWARRFRKTLLFEGLPLDCLPSVHRIALTCKSEAIEPSTAIRLTLSDLLQLTAKHADFQLAMFRLAANTFKRYVMARSLPSEAIRRGYCSSHRGEPSTRRSIGTSTPRIGRVSVYCRRRRAMETGRRYPLQIACWR